MKRFLMIIAGIALGVSGICGGNVVSNVDTSLVGSEKFVLRVDGKPFYMTNVQVRLDKMSGYLDWNDEALEAVVKQAATDGFNTVSIPLLWIDVEPEKDRFDWTVLDKYLGWCRKYGLKMELLWFSWSSGGRIQWAENSPLKPRKSIRVPDYVCTKEGTSEYKILRTTDPWTIDWHDTSLRDRETMVLGKVMEHIAQWDMENGNPHTVIGVQLGNEATGHEQEVSAEEIVDWYHNVATAIKGSDYETWTRMNCIIWQTRGRLEANEKKKLNGGSNIDFIGCDVYGTNADRIYGDVDGHQPDMGSNYSMIMEIDAKDNRTPIYQLSALAGNKAFDYYNYGPVDGNELYTADLKNGSTTLVPHDHITDVRKRNKVLNLANQDIATLAQGKGLYVYNYAGLAMPVEEIGLWGISHKPANGRSQAIAIRHSDNEVILLSTDEGVFNLPSSMKVKSASIGYCDGNNNWVETSTVKVKDKQVTVPEASAVKLTIKK